MGKQKETDLTKTWLKVSRFTFPTDSYESEVLGDTIRKMDSICQIPLGTMHTPLTWRVTVHSSILKTLRSPVIKKIVLCSLIQNFSKLFGKRNLPPPAPTLGYLLTLQRVSIL